MKTTNDNGAVAGLSEPPDPPTPPPLFKFHSTPPHTKCTASERRMPVNDVAIKRKIATAEG